MPSFSRQGLGDIWSDAQEAVLDPEYVNAITDAQGNIIYHDDPPTFTPPEQWTRNQPALTLREPPPNGYPQVIVHPERPNAPFILVAPGWYRSPDVPGYPELSGQTVPYRQVAEYVLTANGYSQQELMARLGQVQSSSGSSIILPVALALALALILRS